MNIGHERTSSAIRLRYLHLYWTITLVRLELCTLRAGTWRMTGMFELQSELVLTTPEEVTREIDSLSLA